jgi:hypothetical protein
MTTSSKPRSCKDCASTTRALPYPGPRCTTCHRAVKKARKARTQALRREKVYGVDPELYEAIWEAQGRVCAACGKPIRSKPCIDHNHDCCDGPTSCGLCIRGILHPDCNRTLIGRFSPQQLIQAARYLLDPPAPKVIAALRGQ